MLARAAALATRRPWAVLAVWLVAVAALATAGLGVADRIAISGVALDRTEAALERDLREAAFGRTATIPVLLEGAEPALSRERRALARRLRADAALRLAVVPGEGRAALLLVVRGLGPGERADDAVDAVTAALRGVAPGVRASATGPEVVASRLSDQGIDEAEQAELLAFPVLLVVLLLLFRSPLAALVPAVAGGATVAASAGVLSLLLDAGAGLDAFAVNLSSIMGLALGVDYSLLLVTRFRDELAQRPGDPAAVAAAVTRTTLTAGRTAAHAAVLLALAMAAAVLFAPGSSVLSAATGTLVTAALAGVSAVVVVPAALALLGTRIDRWRLGGPRGERAGRARVTAAVLRRPAATAAACLVPLLALCAVGTALDAGPPTSRQLPAGDAVRQDVELLRSTLGVGWEAPLEATIAAADGPVTTPALLARAAAAQRRIARLPGVVATLGPDDLARRLAAVRVAPRELAALGGGRLAAAAPGLATSGHLALAAIDGAGPARRSAARLLVDPDRGGRAVRLFVVPDGPAGSARAAAVHARVRAALDDLERTTPGLRAAVGGVGGEVLEYQAALERRFPVLVVALTLVSFAVLALLLRCLLVPAIAVVLNLVTVGATFGALVLLFTGGSPLLGGPGDVDSIALTMVFVVVFALSIDYQVFLLSRMREELGATGSSAAAVRDALRTTGPVVTGAALIMCAVFAAFATTDSVFLRQLGTGLVIAVGLDATVVRMVLLPALLVRLGDAAWAPPRLRRRTAAAPS